MLRVNIPVPSKDISLEAHSLQYFITITMPGKSTSSSSNASSSAKSSVTPAKNYEDAFGALSSQYGYGNGGYSMLPNKTTQPSNSSPATNTFNISLPLDQTHAPAHTSQPTQNSTKK